MGESSSSMYGSVDLLILKTLSLGDAKHGLEIRDEIHHFSARELRIEGNALYPSLHRLEAKGLITGEWQVSEKNRRAKFYTLTAKGRKRLEKVMGEWLRHTEAVRAVLEVAEGEA